MANLMLILTLVLLGTVGVSSERKSYKGYELLSVFARNDADVRVLLEFAHKHHELDFWREPAPGRNATALIPPGLVREFKDVVTGHEIETTVLSDDVQGIVDEGSKRTPMNVAEESRRSHGNVIDHSNYHTYSRILRYLSQLSSRYQNVKVSYLKHKTHEGRSVAVVKLSGDHKKRKPVIIIEAGIHAREWISPASNLWFIEKMLKDYAANDRTARSLLDKYDWYVVPVTNPDGYEYTHSYERLWRKNRRNIGGRCVGVDLNRNFDVKFGTTGVSSNCKFDTYPGASAFSEPETANIRDLFNSLINQVVAYVSVHSYSQYVLVPWGYAESVSRPPNHVELDRVTKLMTSAISNRHGKKYLHGTAYQLLNYAASGASEDWALTRKPGIISLCFELRPSANDHNVGFVLPASEIVATGEELYSSLTVLGRELRTEQETCHRAE